MQTRVAVLLDSVSPVGCRAITFLIEMPRVVLAEFNTHRVLSRSWASSRAIPTNKAAAMTGYRPLWGAAKPGMGAAGPLPPDKVGEADRVYNLARDYALEAVANLSYVGVAKEDANRLTEPFAFTRGVVTGTDWDNFFALRTDSAAYKPFRDVARAMYIAMSKSKPNRLEWEEWHLPFIFPADREIARNLATTSPPDPPAYAAGITTEKRLLCEWSSARCARASYDRFGAGAGPAADAHTFGKLIAGLIHASPMEHPCTPGETSGNLRGYVQFRKLIPRETVRIFNPDANTVAGWEVPDSYICHPDAFWSES